MRTLIVGDCHLSDTPPSVRTEGYAQDILDKLDWIVTFANENSDLLLLLGDVFHSKVPSRTSHRLVQQTASVLEKFKSRVLIVPGNHDMSQDRIDSLPAQPLGALALHPKIEIVMGYDYSTGIYAIPYLDSFETFAEWLEKVPQNADLIATHQSIFPPNVHPPYEHLNMDQIDTDGIPLAFGHIHDSMGFQKVNGAWFCNNGAISRGSLHEETVKREPKVTLFNPKTDGCPFESVDVPHKPAEEVFRLVEHEREVEKAEKLDEFLEGIQGVSLASLSLEEVISHSDSNHDLSPTAKAELKEIVELVLHG